MTNTQNLTREQAEAAARAGAKVRWHGWDDAEWIMIDERGVVDECGRNPGLPFGAYGGSDGWSIVTPAPDAGQPDTAKGADEPSTLIRAFYDPKAGVYCVLGNGVAIEGDTMADALRHAALAVEDHMRASASPAPNPHTEGSRKWGKWRAVPKQAPFNDLHLLMNGVSAIQVRATEDGLEFRRKVKHD